MMVFIVRFTHCKCRNNVSMCDDVVTGCRTQVAVMYVVEFLLPACQMCSLRASLGKVMFHSYSRQVAHG